MTSRPRSTTAQRRSPWRRATTASISCGTAGRRWCSQTSRTGGGLPLCFRARLDQLFVEALDRAVHFWNRAHACVQQRRQESLSLVQFVVEGVHRQTGPGGEGLAMLWLLKHFERIAAEVPARAASGHRGGRRREGL